MGLRSFDLRRLIRSTFELSSAKFASQTVALITLPFVTALYSPEAIGLAAAVLAVMRIIGAGGGASYHFALPLAATRAQAAAVYSLVLYITLGLGLLLLLLLPPATVLYLGSWLPAMGLAVAVAALVVIEAVIALFTQAHIRHRNYRVIAITTILHGLVLYGTIVLLGLIHADAITYLLGYLIGCCTQLWLLGRSTDFRFALRRSARTFVRLRRVAKRYAKFPTVVWPTVTLNAAGNNAPILAVSWLFGGGPAGLFAIGERLALAPVVLLGQSFSQVYVGELAEAVRNNPVRIFAIFRAALLLAVVPAGATFFVIAFLFPAVVDNLLQPQWGALRPLLLPLALLAFWRLIAAAVGRVFIVLERQSIALAWNVGRLAAAFGSFVVASQLGLDFGGAVWLFATTWAAIDLLLIVLAATIASQECRIRTQRTTSGSSAAKEENRRQLHDAGQ